MIGALGPGYKSRPHPVRASGGLDEAAIDALVADVGDAIESRTYLLVLPQFLVTGSVA